MRPCTTPGAQGQWTRRTRPRRGPSRPCLRPVSPSRDSFMEITKIIDVFGYVIYGTLALLAVWGVYNAILLWRGLAKKSLDDAAPLLEQIRPLVHAGKA